MLEFKGKVPYVFTVDENEQVAKVIEQLTVRNALVNGWLSTEPFEPFDEFQINCFHCDKPIVDKLWLVEVNGKPSDVSWKEHRIEFPAGKTIRYFYDDACFSKIELLADMKRSYDGLRDTNLESSVLDYIFSNQNVEHEDIFFIKMLTKMASYIMESDRPLLNGMLPRVVEYNLTGARKCDEDIAKKVFTTENLDNMKCHFYRHAAETLEQEFQESNSTNSIDAAIDYFRQSERLASDLIFKIHSLVGAAKLGYIALCWTGELRYHELVTSIYRDLENLLQSGPRLDNMKDYVSRMRESFESIGKRK